MKKQGFTLLEIIISIFILIILFSVGIALNKWSKNLSLDIKYTGYTYEIQNLLSYGKVVYGAKVF